MLSLLVDRFQNLVYDIKTGSLIGLKTRIHDLEALFPKLNEKEEEEDEMIASYATLFIFKSLLLKFYRPIGMVLTDKSPGKHFLAWCVEKLNMLLLRVKLGFVSFCHQFVLTLIIVQIICLGSYC